MARRVEEDEGYWPGFVDALSTIVMVVTFLLIILGVAIFAISTQVSKAIKDNNAATEQAKTEVEANKQALKQELAKAAQDSAANAQAEAEAMAAKIVELQQSNESETNRLAAQLAQTQTESERLAQQLTAVSQTATKLQQQSAQSEAAVEAAAAEAKKTAQELEKAKEALDAKQTEVADLTRSVETLKQAAAPIVTQDQAVKADNNTRIASTDVAIEPTEITVSATEIDRKAGGVEVVSAKEVLTVKFEESAIDLDAAAGEKAKSFVQLNRDVLDQRQISIWSFYDEASLSVTQAKRTAYFRLLAVRNVLLSEGLDPQTIEISVRSTNDATQFDAVRTFVQ